MAFRQKSGLDAFLHRPEQESFWARLWRSPVKALAQYLYYQRARTELQTRNEIPIRVVCTSDTHNTKPRLSDGDILIHAGDLTQSGTRRELEEQIQWLDSQPHRYKIVVAGNHELCLDSRFSTEENDDIDWGSLIYLENTSAILKFGNGRELKVFGSPCTPKQGNWAFQYLRTNAGIWDEIGITENTDILITHGPPKAHLDLGHLGCRFLCQTLWKMNRRPRLHVFGHIHGAYGKEVAFWDSFQRAYEDIMNENSKWVNFGRLVYYWVVGTVFTGWYADRRQNTVMINAAAVGGVRDEKRREAICVDL